MLGLKLLSFYAGAIGVAPSQILPQTLHFFSQSIHLFFLIQREEVLFNPNNKGRLSITGNHRRLVSYA